MIKYNLNNFVESFIYTDTDYISLNELAKNRNVIIISDFNLFEQYPDFFANKRFIILPPGEDYKNIETIKHIYNKFIELKVDRHSLIVGFGGGIVCDITGFAAATFMRGIKFCFIPSTLLAQVDAAIGGKNGVNFDNIKNYIGTFSHPEFIIYDSELLKTLPDNEYKNGFGEVIKYALIANNNLFSFISENQIKIREKNKPALDFIITKCIETKIKFVEIDPNDLGARHILNFGHSFGHCFEILDNIPHGIAVVKGINAALDLSLKLNYTNQSTVDLIKDFTNNSGYDISYELKPEHFDLLAKDKKKNSDYLNFVFFRDIGDLFISSIKFDDIIKAFS
jgi:3-dehydroquinate synthase